MTDEYKKRISEGIKKHYQNGGKKVWLGRKHSEETKKKIALKATGNTRRKGMKNSPEHNEKIRQKLMGNKNSLGEINVNWKGNHVGYSALHDWVARHVTDPKLCQHCRSKRRKLEWANVSMKYLRKPEDWIRLCIPCHRKYDSGRHRGAIKKVFDKRLWRNAV